MLDGRGSCDIPANEWIAYIQQQDPERGYVLSETPVVGAIAIENGGIHGHVSYVEEILSSNQIRVSEYDTLPGSYSESIVSTQGILFLVRSPMGGKSA